MVRDTQPVTRRALVWVELLAILEAEEVVCYPDLDTKNPRVISARIE